MFWGLKGKTVEFHFNFYPKKEILNRKREDVCFVYVIYYCALVRTEMVFYRGKKVSISRCFESNTQKYAFRLSVKEKLTQKALKQLDLVRLNIKLYMNIIILVIYIFWIYWILIFLFVWHFVLKLLYLNNKMFIISCEKRCHCVCNKSAIFNL